MEGRASGRGWQRRRCGAGPRIGARPRSRGNGKEARAAETRRGWFGGCGALTRKRQGSEFFEGCEQRRGEAGPPTPARAGNRSGRHGGTGGNAANLVRCRLQHTGGRSAEEAVEVGRNHEDGTKVAPGRCGLEGGNPGSGRATDESEARHPANERMEVHVGCRMARRGVAPAELNAGQPVRRSAASLESPLEQGGNSQDFDRPTRTQASACGRLGSASASAGAWVLRRFRRDLLVIAREERAIVDREGTRLRARSNERWLPARGSRRAGGGSGCRVTGSCELFRDMNRSSGAQRSCEFKCGCRASRLFQKWRERDPPLGKPLDASWKRRRRRGTGEADVSVPRGIVATAVGPCPLPEPSSQ